jgi:cytochrome oxidase Cu insertion factor (SCO1/SenC/PrrC family)
MTRSAAAPRPKRGMLLLLLLLFFSPLLMAFLVYYGSNWRPVGHTNHGTLIEPARTLPRIPLPQSAAPGDADLLIGKWSLLYIGDGACESECRNTLYFMRQTQLSLGNLIPRVQRVWLATDHCCDRTADSQTQPLLIYVNAQAAQAATLLGLFPGDARASTIFIVDPRGNLMMRYDSHADPKGLREDLKKLLSLSHIG